jgi:hypothetical protein
MLGEDTEGQVIQKGGERLRKSELKRFVIDPVDFNLGPQVFYILREKRTAALDDFDAKDDVIACNGLSVVPDRIRTN